MKRYFIHLPVIFLMVSRLTWAQAGAHTERPSPSTPMTTDRCPVCGMFVAKYPEWTAQIVFRDGERVFFDGAKDMFKFHLDLSGYAPHRTHEDIAIAYVTEYYEMSAIDASGAFFVIGSDVFGPMGRELIPFKDPADAQAFLKDHQGERVLRFDQVIPATLKRLD